MLGYGSWREVPLPNSEPPFQAQPASPPTAQLRGEAVSRWPGPLGPLGSAGPRGPALRGAQAPLLPNAPPGRCRPGPPGGLAGAGAQRVPLTRATALGSCSRFGRRPGTRVVAGSAPGTVPACFQRASRAPRRPPSRRALVRPRRSGQQHRDLMGSASPPAPDPPAPRPRPAFQAGRPGLGPPRGPRVRLGRSAASAPSRGLRTRRSSPGRLRRGRSGPAGRGLGAEPARTRAGPGPRRSSLPPVPAHPLSTFGAFAPQRPCTWSASPLPGSHRTAAGSPRVEH